MAEPASRRYVRITGVPPGEAPLWVREKWVGLVLPVAIGKERRLGRVITSGVLSRPRNDLMALVRGLFGGFKLQAGYAVDANEAVQILAQSAPGAAAWWRQNVLQRFVKDRTFLFHASVCEPVTSR